MAAAWTGVGVVKPEAASFLCKLEDRGSSVNVLNWMVLFLLAETDRFGERGTNRAERAMPRCLYAESTEGTKGGESQISLKALKEPATHNRT